MLTSDIYKYECIFIKFDRTYYHLILTKPVIFFTEEVSSRDKQQASD